MFANSSTHPLAAACSLLFVPGHRLDRLPKALASGAGAVIVDWEDAVGPADKPGAREQFGPALVACSPAERARLLVRINAAGTPWHDADVAALRPLAAQGLRAVVVPKAERAELLAGPAAALGEGEIGRASCRERV